MKQCCANCKYGGTGGFFENAICKFYDTPAKKTIWWNKTYVRTHYIYNPTRSGKTCKCWQEKQ